MNYKQRVTSYCVLISVLGFGIVTAVSIQWGALFPVIEAAEASELPKDLVRAAGEPIEPIPLFIELNAGKVLLGKRLFHDHRLSRDDSVACSSCHDLEMGGTDQLPRSRGIGGALGEVNSPTVFNCGLQFKFFWDGRSNTLEDQIDGPIHNPIEMGTDWSNVTRKIQLDPGYRESFARAYPDGIRSENIKDAIATFERSLITPNSTFDQYLRGDGQAISRDEKEGYRLFNQLGCIACHQGVMVGGNMFETFGVAGDYFVDRGNETRADLGRYNVTGKDGDRHKFKVPSLRNVALTAPYFHDGSAKNLEDAVEVMIKYQLGREISSAEVALVVKFLKTLTGKYQGRPL